MYKAKQETYLFQTAQGGYIFYGLRCKGYYGVQMYIGESLEALREVKIPNAHWLKEVTPAWVESDAGTLCSFHSDKWIWFAGRQIDPTMTIEAGPDKALKQLDLSEFDIDVRHMTMSLTRKTQSASDEVDAIHEEFETEFKSIDKFGITGTAIGHPVGDFPTIRVYVLSEGAKQQLTKELRMRDHSQDFLIYKGARIQIVVTGHIV